MLCFGFDRRTLTMIDPQNERMDRECAATMCGAGALSLSQGGQLQQLHDSIEPKFSVGVETQGVEVQRLPFTSTEGRSFLQFGVAWRKYGNRMFVQIVCIACPCANNRNSVTPNSRSWRWRFGRRWGSLGDSPRFGGGNVARTDNRRPMCFFPSDFRRCQCLSNLVG